MAGRGNIDPILRALGGRARYQLLQFAVINLGAFGAAYQLFDNLFIGREVEGLRCSAPGNVRVNGSQESVFDLESSIVTYGQCEITVYNNLTGETQQHPCPSGYDYSYPRELSFRTEFDLVCDHKLLGGLVQTCVIAGQGVGAVLASIVSDRFGRKRTLVGSQGGLLVVGLAIGASPNYAVLAALKFVVGGFQQGVVTGIATMSIELFPMEIRSISALMGPFFWGVGNCLMPLIAYLLKEHTWRYLQYTLSGVSFLIMLLQLWYLDESLRWLVANGRTEAAVGVLERAALVNRKDLNNVLQCLQATDTDSKAAEKEEKKMRHNTDCPPSQHDSTNCHVLNATEDQPSADHGGNEDKAEQTELQDDMLHNVQKTLEQKHSQKQTLLDIFRHRRLLFNAFIVWIAWFTCAFSVFTLYMMSTSLHGDRFLNYFLTALMGMPPSVIKYFMLDRLGRKKTTRTFYFLAGVGLVLGGIFRVYKDNITLATLSVVAAMVGMVGGSGSFGTVFFVTPELFPTNMRNQALGVASFTGRLGGMLAPFMTELGEIAIWAPGAIVGSLCFLVVVLFGLLPETQGRELPHTIDEVKNWNKKGSIDDSSATMEEEKVSA